MNPGVAVTKCVIGLHSDVRQPLKRVWHGNISKIITRAKSRVAVDTSVYPVHGICRKQWSVTAQIRYY